MLTLKYLLRAFGTMNLLKHVKHQDLIGKLDEFYPAGDKKDDVKRRIEYLSEFDFGDQDAFGLVYEEPMNNAFEKLDGKLVARSLEGIISIDPDTVKKGVGNVIEGNVPGYEMRFFLSTAGRISYLNSRLVDIDGKTVTETIISNIAKPYIVGAVGQSTGYDLKKGAHFFVSTYIGEYVNGMEKLEKIADVKMKDDVQKAYTKFMIYITDKSSSNEELFSITENTNRLIDQMFYFGETKAHGEFLKLEMERLEKECEEDDITSSDINDIMKMHADKRSLRHSYVISEVSRIQVGGWRADMKAAMEALDGFRLWMQMPYERAGEIALGVKKALEQGRRTYKGPDDFEIHLKKSVADYLNHLGV